MTVGEKSVNPLPDGTSLTKQEPSAGAALRQCSPSKSAVLYPKCLHKAYLHIVNIRRNCNRKSLKFVVNFEKMKLKFQSSKFSVSDIGTVNVKV